MLGMSAGSKLQFLEEEYFFARCAARKNNKLYKLVLHEQAIDNPSIHQPELPEFDGR